MLVEVAPGEMRYVDIVNLGYTNWVSTLIIDCGKTFSRALPSVTSS